MVTTLQTIIKAHYPKIFILLGVVLMCYFGTKLKVVPESRAGLTKLAALVDEHTPKHSKVYVIWQGTKGFEHRVLQYELAPRMINKACWSLGKPIYFKPDVWTCNWSIRRFKRALRKYDYILLAHVDRQFWRKYGRLFSFKQYKHGKRLYRI